MKRNAVFAFFGVALIAAIGYYIYTKKLGRPVTPQVADLSTSTSPTNGQTQANPPPNTPYHDTERRFETSCKPEPLPTDDSWKQRVSFSQLKEIFSKIEMSTVTVLGNGVQDTQNYSIRFFDFGAVSSGPHSGGRLVVAHLYFSHMVNEADGDRSGVTFHRFILDKDQLVQLPKLSNGPDNRDFLESALNGLNLKRTADNDFTIPVLQEPLRAVSVAGACLNFSEQLPEERTSPIRTVGSNPFYGEFYWAGNFLHTKLPDGTLLSYYSLPPSELDSLAGTSEDKYACFGEPGKREASGTPDLVAFEPDLEEQELRELKTLPNLGKVYVPKEAAANPAIQRIHEQFKKDHAQYVQYQGEESIRNLSPFLKIGEYVKRNPIIYWRDPLSRWIRCENTALRVPSMAEPIIYLYPETSQIIEVSIDKKVRLRDSIPPVENHSWKVKADPTGEITFLKDGKTYPHLYWEGKYAPLAPPKQGFVVRKEEIHSFLKVKLDRLGLNEKESQAFRDYWVPRMARNPYYLVTFLDQSTINAIAPLSITPKPTVLIRVMMDFVPLDSPIIVSEPDLPSPPKRTGFSVVEWGGMAR